MKQYVAVGLTVLAGAALIESVLVPGIVIGGAAILAPKVLPKLPGLLLRQKPRNAKRGANAKTAAGGRRSRAADAMADQRRPKFSLAALPEILPRIAIGQAVAKTITYRIIVTSLDFATNYIIIGELATAAGLSSFNLVFGPLYYLGHEAVWNYFHEADGAVELPPLTAAGAQAVEEGASRFTLSPALAKTITFRVFATIFDFSANFVVVGNVAEAVLLSATGFILGPFVYYGHEKAWEYFTARGEQPSDRVPEMRLLPAPA